LASPNNPLIIQWLISRSLYQEGYALGFTDGEQAGRIEGRTFGLERGFDKFLELGRLQGRCSVWKARIKSPASPDTTSEATNTVRNYQITNPRAQKQIELLSLLLTNPPFKNNEESVEEVEETLKKGRGKGKVLMNMLGEKGEQKAGRGRKVVGENESIEDAGRLARDVSGM
jgi:hypothetical protein